jgi:hypothetical protein
MDSKRALLILGISAVFALTSCSGLKTAVCTVNCGGSGNASLTISLYDTPPTGTNVLSFTLPIAGISLTPSSGSPQSVTTVISSVEATRLQTDSAVIVDQASVPAADYSAINVTLGPTSSTNNLFINTSGSTITYGTHSCVSGAICALPVGAIYTISVPLTLNLSANQNQWIELDFNLSKAITTSGGISVDFSQTGVLTATTTTRTGIPSGSVDTLEDFTGVVTAYTAGSSITVQSAIRGVSLTASLSTNTEYDLAPSTYSQCQGTASACVTVGSTVSVDAVVSSGGTFTATEVDVLDLTAVDEVEGIIYPTLTQGVFGMILADKVSASGNSTLSAATATYGRGVLLTLNATNYSVDTKTLSSQLSAPAGFSGSGDLLGGQVVRAQITGISTDNNGNITASATNMLLRYSRLSGTLNSVAGSVFTVASLPGYIYALNTSLSSTPQVYTYLGLTAFDGITGLSDPTLQAGTTTVSIRALYLNPLSATYPFQAAKVRVP